MTDSGSLAKRPQFLEKIVKAIDSRDNEDRDTYHEFLRRSLDVANTPEGKALKLDWHVDVESMDSTYNCSLCYIFYFYAKSQTASQKYGSKPPNMDIEEYARDSLSLFALLLFCRDFRIIPRFLIRDEISFLWKVMNAQKVRMGQTATKLLDFRSFKDFLGRMAVMAFNKPGMKKIILKSTGNMPSLNAQVESFAMYLHLDDMNWVRNRIHTVGRETIGAINYRSQGEVNLQTKLNLKNDLKGKRLYKVMNSNKAVFDKPNRGDGNYNGHGHVADRGDDSIMDVHKPDLSPAISNIAHALHSKVIGVTATGGVTDITDSKGDHSPRSARCDGGANPDIALLTELATRICVGDDNIDDIEMEAMNVANVYLDSNQNDYESKTNTLLPKGLAFASSFEISKSQENALIHYEPSLSAVFDPYCDMSAYIKHKKSSAVNSAVGAPSGPVNIENASFLDIGTQQCGHKCVIQVKVLNYTSHEVYVNVSTQGLSAEGMVRVATLPCSFAPGLSRLVNISFKVEQPPKNLMNVLAMLEIQLVCPHGIHVTESATCPVFFRVVSKARSVSGGDARHSLYPYCTQRNLSSLCDKFHIWNVSVSSRNHVVQSTPPSHANRDIFGMYRDNRDNNGRGDTNIDILHNGGNNNHPVEEFVGFNILDIQPSEDIFPFPPASSSSRPTTGRIRSAAGIRQSGRLLTSDPNNCRKKTF